MRDHRLVLVTVVFGFPKEVCGPIRYRPTDGKRTQLAAARVLFLCRH